MTRSRRRGEYTDPLKIELPKRKGRIGVMPTRREDDKRKRPPRHRREIEQQALAYISHR